MKSSWNLIVTIAALFGAVVAGAQVNSSRYQQAPKENWCVGPIVALDAAAGMLTIEVKESGQTAATQTAGPIRLGSFIVASSSPSSELPRTFQCAPQCRFATSAKPAGATLADFKLGDIVRVTCTGSNNNWSAQQVVHHTPAPPQQPQQSPPRR
jgi:hypothetical protein